MKLRTKSVPPTKVEKATKVESRSEKGPRSDPSADDKKLMQPNEERMQLRSKHTISTLTNHTNKKFKKSEQIKSNETSNGKIGIEKKENFIENEPVSVSVTDSNNQNRKENPSNNQNQSLNNIPIEKDVSGNEVREESATNLNRMQLRSKLTVTTLANHTNKKFKKSEQIKSNKTSNGKIGIEEKENFIENEPVSTSVTDSNNQNRKENPSNNQNQSLNNIPIEKDVSGNEVREESATNLNRRSSRLRTIQTATTSTENSMKKTEKRLAVRSSLQRSGSWSIGSIVLVKWSSFPYWPAQVTAIDKKIHVTFFGDNCRTAKVKKEQIYDFEANSDYIIKTLNCRQWKCRYVKAIHETEICIGIPPEMSLINNHSN